MKNILIILTIFTIVSSCKKNENNDYRDSYCGNYNFTVHNWFSCINGYFTQDTEYCSGTINKFYMDSSIVINYNPGRNKNFCYNDSITGTYFEAKINNNGLMSNDSMLNCSAGYYATKSYFSNKNTVIISLFNTGSGLGCQYGQDIIGIRK